MKPICTKCQRFYRPKENGHFFIEGMPKNGNPLPGTAEPDAWVPYKLWCGDLWECRGCGHTLIVGAGHSPVSEHYLPDFAETVERISNRTGSKMLQVNDC